MKFEGRRAASRRRISECSISLKWAYGPVDTSMWASTHCWSFGSHSWWIHHSTPMPRSRESSLHVPVAVSHPRRTGPTSKPIRVIRTGNWSQTCRGCTWRQRCCRSTNLRGYYLPSYCKIWQYSIRGVQPGSRIHKIFQQGLSKACKSQQSLQGTYEVIGAFGLAYKCVTNPFFVHDNSRRRVTRIAPNHCKCRFHHTKVFDEAS